MASRRALRCPAAFAVAIGGLSAVAAGSCATLGPPPSERTVPIREYDLDSGLRVTVEQEDNGGRVGIAWVADVGTVDDPAEVPGMAHLVEHLVMRSADPSGSSLTRHLAALGAGETNAFTRSDLTIFYTVVPSRARDAAIAQMAARLADLAANVDDALIAKERAVVAEEMRLKRGNAGALGLRLALLAVAPVGYGPELRELETDLGTVGALSAASVRQFFQRHYRPERMTLVVSGALSRDDDRRVITDLPRSLTGSGSDGRTAIRRPLALPGSGPGPDQGLMTRPAAVGACELWVAWPLPAMTGLASESFDVLAAVVQEILSAKVSDGTLSQVVSVGCGAEESAVGGGLLCRALLTSGADPADVKKRIVHEVDSLDATARQPAALTVRQAILSRGLSFEALGPRLLARAVLTHQNPDAQLSAVIETISAMTPNMVGDLAYRYLTADLARGVLLVPAGRRAPQTAAAATGVGLTPASATSVAADDQVDPTAMDDPEPIGNVRDVAIAPGTSGAWTARLGNGLTVIALRRRGFASASMILGFHADPQPGDAPGAAAAALHSRLFWSTESPLLQNLLYSARASRDSYEERIAMFAADAPSAIRLLALQTDMVTVKWPAPAFERWVQLSIPASSSPVSRAEAEFRRALWRDNPYGARLTREEAPRLTKGQIRAWLDRVHRPANGALVVVGDIDPESIVRLAADALSDWKRDPAVAPPPPPPQVAPRPALSVQRTIDPQRSTLAIHFGCFVQPLRSSKDLIVRAVLTQLIRSELDRRLRDNLGVSYTIQVSGDTLRGGTSLVDGQFDASPGSDEAVMRVLNGWLAPTGPLPDEHALVRARWRVAQNSVVNGGTNLAVAGMVFDAWNVGLPLESLDRFPQEVAEVGMADLAGALSACRASAVVSVVGP
jgi:zinc protease